MTPSSVSRTMPQPMNPRRRSRRTTCQSMRLILLGRDITRMLELQSVARKNQVMSAVGQLIVWYVGGREVLAGTMTLGSLMAFLVDAYAEDEAPNAKGGVDTDAELGDRGDPGAARHVGEERDAELEVGIVEEDADVAGDRRRDVLVQPTGLHASRGAPGETRRVE